MALALRFRILLLAIITTTLVGGVFVGSAAACTHEMEPITVEENAVYMAEWRIEQRMYRKAIQTIIKEFPSLPDDLNGLDVDTSELTYEELQAAHLLATATARSNGKWSFSKSSKRLSKSKRIVNLKWALQAVGKLRSIEGGSGYDLAEVELMHALGQDPQKVLTAFEAVFSAGAIYQSKPLETLAKVRTADGDAAGAKKVLAMAVENRGFEKQTPRPDHEVFRPEAPQGSGSLPTAAVAVRNPSIPVLGKIAQPAVAEPVVAKPVVAEPAAVVAEPAAVVAEPAAVVAEPLAVVAEPVAVQELAKAK